MWQTADYWHVQLFLKSVYEIKAIGVFLCFSQILMVSSKIEYHALQSQFARQACYRLIIKVVQLFQATCAEQPAYARNFQA